MASLSTTTNAQRQADALQRINSSGELKVGYVVFPPWIIKDANTGALSGSYVETIQEIARLMPVKLTFVEASWATFVAGLQTGQFDLSIVPSFVTVGRAKVVNFTRPISYTGNTALVRSNDKRFSKLSDLDAKGVSIVVTQGTQEHEYATKNFRQANVKALSTFDMALLFTEVVSGKADAALSDTYNVSQFVKTHREVRDLLSGKPYSVLPVAWAVRYDDMALWQFLNSSLSFLEGSGFLREVGEKYQLPNDKPL